MPKESTNEPEKAETDADRKGNWAEDQEERRYYYDDAHGYEKYVPDDEDEQSEEDKTDNDQDQ